VRLKLPSICRSLYFLSRRSLVDFRAAKAVAATIFLVLSSIAYLAFYLVIVPFYLESFPDPISWYFFLAFIFCSGWVAFLIMRYLRKSDIELLNFSIVGNNERIDQSPGQSRNARIYLSARTHILGSLMLRSIVEIRAAIGPGGYATDESGRAAHNQPLWNFSLWEFTEGDEQSLLISPEGSWSEPDQVKLFEWSEQLRVLRWVSGIDDELLFLAHRPAPNPELAHGLPPPALLATSDRWVDSFELYLQRDVAAAYSARALAEIKIRSADAAGGDLKMEDWEEELVTKLKGASNDLWAGPHVIATLQDQELVVLAQISNARSVYLNYLLEQLNSPSPVSLHTWKQAQEFAHLSTKEEFI
jgi:hypothetical protein